jgi:hypothetical protein
VLIWHYEGFSPKFQKEVETGDLLVIYAYHVEF